jgi:hypothetical protein
MQSGSNNPDENQYSSRRYGPPYTEDSYNRREDTHEPSAAMQSGVSAVSNDFSVGSISFAHPEPLNYAPEDFSHVPTWSADNLYGFPDSHGRASDYGLGYPNDNGGSSSYFSPDGASMTYGEHVTESSEQHNTYHPVFQSGQNMPDAGFDLTSFQMPPRTLTSAPAPISSADMFNDTTVP